MSCGRPSSEARTGTNSRRSRTSTRCAMRSPSRANTMRIEPQTSSAWLFIGSVRLDRLAAGSAPAKVGVEETLNISVEHRVEAAHVVAGAGVFHPLIGMQKIVANLRAEAGFGLRTIFRRLLGLAFFLFQPRQAGA